MTLLDRLMTHLRRLSDVRNRCFKVVRHDRFEALTVVRVLRIGDELVLDASARLTASYQAVFLPTHRALSAPANDSHDPALKLSACLRSPG